MSPEVINPKTAKKEAVAHTPIHIHPSNYSWSGSSANLLAREVHVHITSLPDLQTRLEVSGSGHVYGLEMLWAKGCFLAQTCPYPRPCQEMDMITEPFIMRSMNRKTDVNPFKRLVLLMTKLLMGGGCVRIYTFSWGIIL